jgi:phosphoribosylglycinamide formyltransferase-1
MLDAGLDVAAVIVDRPCVAADLASEAGLHVEIIERGSYGPDFDRTAYTARVIDSLKKSRVDVVAMAGYGTILAPDMFAAFPGRILNTHPALLPAFKGWHAVRDALAAGVKITGCTVHVATVDVDEGPILAQEAVRVEPGDTESVLHERIKAVERRLYPEAIRLFLQTEAQGASR